MEAGLPIVLVAQCPEAAAWRLGGRTLVERLQAQAERLGAATPMRHESGTTAGSGLVVAISTALVLDERLLALALTQREPVVFVDGARGGAAIGLAVVPADRVEEAFADPAAFPNLDIDRLPRFWMAQRRNLKPYAIRIENADDLARARRIVANAAGKGHQEWTVILFNRPVETLISRFLCETAITPNQITVASFAFGIAAALLLAIGALGWAFAACVATCLLDGLDGRQARTQVRFSPHGELEHAADKVVELAWIAGLAWHLSAHGATPAPLLGGGLWIGLMFLDNVSGSYFRARTGFLPDLATPLDSWLRLVAPRRNTNLVYLAVGALAGHLLATFWIVVAATAAFTAIHWIRVAQLLRHPPPRPWLAESRHRAANLVFGVPD